MDYGRSTRVSVDVSGIMSFLEKLKTKRVERELGQFAQKEALGIQLTPEEEARVSEIGIANPNLYKRFKEGQSFSRYLNEMKSLQMSPMTEEEHLYQTQRGASLQDGQRPSWEQSPVNRQKADVVLRYLEDTDPVKAITFSQNVDKVGLENALNMLALQSKQSTEEYQKSKRGYELGELERKEQDVKTVRDIMRRIPTPSGMDSLMEVPEEEGIDIETTPIDVVPNFGASIDQSRVNQLFEIAIKTGDPKAYREALELQNRLESSRLGREKTRQEILHKRELFPYEERKAIAGAETGEIGRDIKRFEKEKQPETYERKTRREEGLIEQTKASTESAKASTRYTRARTAQVGKEKTGISSKRAREGVYKRPVAYGQTIVAGVKTSNEAIMQEKENILRQWIAGHTVKLGGVELRPPKTREAYESALRQLGYDPMWEVFWSALNQRFGVRKGYSNVEVLE